MSFYFKEEWRAPAAVGVLSFVAGVGIGYLVGIRRVNVLQTTVHHEIDTEDIKEQLKLDFQKAAREAFSPNEGRLPFKGVEAPRMGETNHVVIKPRWASDVPADPEPELEEEVDDGWNQEEEEADRGPNAPYVIHKNEFDSDENGYRQTALEYFSGDDVLCDENRIVVYNASQVVGRLEFGRGSGQPDVVYIRNDELKSEFEVTRVHGSYQTEVLGLEAEEQADADDLKHSNSVLKFRSD